MKKYLKDIVLVVVTAIIASTVGVAAYNYNAKDIEYNPKDSSWKVSTVAEAINSLVNDTRKSFIKYSEEETVIGEWIDGKPLYQKTFNGSWDVPWNNANMKGVLAGVTPLITDATLISASGVGTSGNRTICTDLYIDNDINSWTIFIANPCKLTSITIQYTKTTDSASNS